MPLVQAHHLQVGEIHIWKLGKLLPVSVGNPEVDGPQLPWKRPKCGIRCLLVVSAMQPCQGKDRAPLDLKTSCYLDMPTDLALELMSLISLPLKSRGEEGGKWYDTAWHVRCGCGCTFQCHLLFKGLTQDISSLGPLAFADRSRVSPTCASSYEITTDSQSSVYPHCVGPGGNIH